MRKIAIRIDDITPEMDWKKYRRFEELLEKYGIRPLIGVVPENCDPKLEGEKGTQNSAFEEEEAFGVWLREKQKDGWSIALHGCFHTYMTGRAGLFPLNHFSEFAGRPYGKQLEMIRYGQERLREWGVDTDIFMAPGHSFDKNTLRALRECGFRYVTDGYGSRPYRREGLVFLPISFLRKRELRHKDGLTTFVLHTWEMEDKDFLEYEKLFAQQRERFIDYKELAECEAVQRGAAAAAAEYLCATLKSLAGKVI